jgi:arsenite methyltransferase
VRPFAPSFVFRGEMNTQPNDITRAAVRETYGKIATDTSRPCGCAPSCCNPNSTIDTTAAARRVGYTEKELAAAPDGANLGLGCGNPFVFAGIEAGHTVLDLGSGAGFDAFLAANVVGPTGNVIGVDMTPEMVTKARANAARSGYTHIQFRLGEIEHLPVADATVDVIISNCVINLSPDKPAVFRDAFRVLKPGGRIAISDVVALKPMPLRIRESIALHAGCIAGTSLVPELEAAVKAAGFEDITIEVLPESRQYIAEYFPGEGLEEYAASATIRATKPA